MREGANKRRKSEEHKSGFRLFGRCVRLLNQADPGGLTVEFLAVIPEQACEFFYIYLSAIVVTAVAQNGNMREVIRLTAAICAAEFVFRLLARLLRGKRESRVFARRQNLMRIVWEKVMNMDYVHIERLDTHLKFAQVQYGIARLLILRQNIVQCWLGAVNFMISLFLVLPLMNGKPAQTGGFAGFLQSRRAVFLLLIVITAVQLIQQKLAAKKQFQIVDDTNRSREVLMGSRIRKFYLSFVFERYRTGKDIRLFDESGMVLKECADSGDMVENAWKEAGKKLCGYQLFTAMLNLLPEIFITLFAVARAMTGTLAVGDVIMFILYFSRLLWGLSVVTNGIVGIGLNLPNGKAVLDFLDIPEQKYRGTLPTEKRDDNEYEFEFRHVSFRYPGAQEDVLKDVSLKWRIGEKMALVGRNGSGKSTLVKLLCRLYDPTGGEILLNGIDIRKYNYDEYMALFSVVFQDSDVFSFSIAENVAVSADYDAKRVEECVRKSGLSERLDAMPAGIETCLYRHFDECGVELSGGEAQKLVLARAVYRGSPFLVLDEPTSALDPVSEHEIYTKFNAIVGTRTAIYISHRLSSCCFCDDIAVLKDGAVAEHGTHGELLARNGEYAAMWRAQAEYYKDSAGELFL